MPGLLSSIVPMAAASPNACQSALIEFTQAQWLGLTLVCTCQPKMSALVYTCVVLPSILPSTKG